MKLLILSIVTINLILLSCDTPRVGPIKNDSDIVLVNIQEGDREFIAKILLKIDSLKPKAVGINVYFASLKDGKRDSLLTNVLRNLKGDVLSYGLDNEGNERHSLPIFTSAVSDEGFLDLNETNGLVSHMTPVVKIAESIKESFALKIAKRWSSNLNISFSPNKSIPIEYTRTANSFFNINGDDLISLPIAVYDLENMKNKIFLLGYLGPSEEDKYRTPLRVIANDTISHNQPDTYGLVIIANQIRTLLDKNSD